MAKRETTLEFRIRDRFSRGFRRLRRRVRGFSRDLLRIVRNSSLVTTALGAFTGIRLFGGAIQSSIEFEEQLRVVQGVSGATAEELAKLQAAAEEQGASTRFTATEAAQGLEELARAGQNVSESVSTLPNALRLAQANAIPLADAAQLTTTTLNQFRLAADQSGRVADVLSAGTQNAAQNITELGNALEFAGPQAQLSNLTLEQTVAILGRLADVGFRGEKGGTALRNALIELQDPSTAFNDELRRLGIVSDDFLVVLDELAQRGPAAERALTALGKRAGPAISTLVTSGTADLRELIATLNNSGGTAERTAAIMDDNLAGALKNLGSAWDAARRALIDPLLKPLADQARELATRLRELVKSGDLTQFGERLAKAFSDGIERVKEFIREFDFDQAKQDFSEFVDLVKTGSSGISKGLKAIEVVFRGIQGSVALIGAGLTGIVVLFKRAQLAGQEFGQKLGLGDRSEEIAELENQLEGFTKTFEELGEQAGKSFEKGADGIREIIGATGEATESANELEGAANDAGDALSGLGDEEKAAAIERVGQRVIGLLGRVRDFGANAGNAALSALQKVNEFSADTADQQLQRLTARYSELQAAGQGNTDEARRLEQQLQSLSNTAAQDIGTKAVNSIRDLREQLTRTAEEARLAFESAIVNDGTLEEQRQAFLAYAEAAIEANNGIVDGQIRSQAQALGLSRELQRLQQEFRNVGTEADKAAGSAGNIGKQIQEAGEETAQASTGISANLRGILSGYFELGQGVTDTVNRIVERNAIAGVSVQQFLRGLARDLEDFNERRAAALERAEQAIIAANFGLDDFANQARLARDAVDVLDQATLDRLTAVIDRAEQRVQSFTRSAQADINALERDIANLRGEQASEDQELKELQDQILEFQRELQNVNASGDQAAISAASQRVRLAQELLAIRRKQIEEERRARREQERNGTATNDTRGRDPDPREQPTPPPQRAGGVTGPINATIQIVSLGEDPVAARQLARIVRRELDKLDRATR